MNLNNQPEASINDISSLTSFIQNKYNYDFSNYALSSFRRRIERYLDIMKFDNIEELISHIDSEENFKHFLKELTVNVTEMFRDPSLWAYLRNNALPDYFSKNDNLKVWHAGCSSGEEVYSLNIILSELNQFDKTEIVASDIDRLILNKAETARYPKKILELNNNNFQLTGTNNTLDPYINEEELSYTIKDDLKQNISFKEHNLVSSNYENQFDIIFCRNVLIYFNQPLQNKVLEGLHKSLKKNGLLIIGAKESIAWCNTFSNFETISLEEKIFMKKA